MARVSVRQVTFQTSHGQLLDLTTAPPGSVDLGKYTLDNYMRIVTYKTVSRAVKHACRAGVQCACRTCACVRVMVGYPRWLGGGGARGLQLRARFRGRQLIHVP